MRIAIFTETYRPYVSGVVTHIETIKSSLEQAGHKVLIVATKAGLDRQYLEDGVLYCPGKQLKRIYGYGLCSPYSAERMARIRGFAPDLIHIHTEFSMGLFGLAAARELGIPAVYTMHTYYDEYLPYVAGDRAARVLSPVAHRYLRFFAGQMDEIIAPAKKVARYLARCGLDRTCHILPNTVPLQQFYPDNIDPAQVQALRGRLGIRAGDVCLGFVGRLGQEKSIDRLVQSFISQFLGEGRFKLFLLGEGPERTALESIVRRNRAEEQVFLLGNIPHEQIPVYHQCLDLYTTASLSEVHSISLIEAGAAGLYAVNMLDVMNREQLVTGVDGEFYQTDDEFGAAVRRYAALDDDGRRTVRQQVSAAAGRHDPVKYCDALHHVYDRALDRHSRAVVPVTSRYAS